ncbi:hypothetical protein LEP1GSC193_1980 [Leptospira alstonii serovar Pingchang str. 80-412]|uniref:Uncharacterized protein n=2 Tax=Leptospira alstonii TaxID=28452 RepID=M6D505_9LEPT|nr:hypothetical protein LEP1GSC194_1713 [Leptospira alstonii serovar Sichuan str. 79601]EQA81463.1 hypothetical protein LEP1GSC193_1980 [Leptospira alstonii serovar Pingchang str. 80-412]
MPVFTIVRNQFFGTEAIAEPRTRRGDGAFLLFTSFLEYYIL